MLNVISLVVQVVCYYVFICIAIESNKGYFGKIGISFQQMFPMYPSLKCFI